MAHKGLIVALGLIAAASPASAANREQAPTRPAPTDSADARYCLRIEPITGSRLEHVRCWTRAEWAEKGVDVDQEWDKEGVSIIR